MNRAARRKKAREITKGREERRVIARALKHVQVPEEELDPYPNLRAEGFVIAEPRFQVPASPVRTVGLLLDRLLGRGP